MDLKQTRIERLKQYAKSRDVLHDPSGLAALIGKKPNQVYNLLHGMASFGEKVARSIEEAAGLPRFWLDSEESVSRNEPSSDALKLAKAIDSIPDPESRDQVLKLCNELVRMQLKRLAPPTESRQARRKQM